MSKLICWHEWEKWKNDIATILADPTNPVRPTFEDRKADIQYRYCVKCGKKQVRYVR